MQGMVRKREGVSLLGCVANLGSCVRLSAAQCSLGYFWRDTEATPDTLCLSDVGASHGTSREKRGERSNLWPRCLALENGSEGRRLESSSASVLSSAEVDTMESLQAPV